MQTLIMWIKYFIFVPISIIGDILAWVFAPIFCLFYRRDKDPIDEVDRDRELLYFPFDYLTTHDAHVDTYLVDSYWKNGTLFTKILTDHKSWFTRYIGRIVWVWRNPGYKLDHMMGYDQKGMVVTTHADSKPDWDTGRPSYGYKTAINEKGQKAFLWEKQIYYYKNWCIELQFGWKLYRNDPDQICMLAFRFSPFKRY